MNRVGISLGNACASAIWGKNMSIRKSKEEGYNTCPFDLMLSNYKGICKCIREDFTNFINPDYLVLKTNPAPDCIINTYYNFGFNHETPYHADLYKSEKWSEGPNHFMNNNYANFIKRYATRINNFKNYLEDSTNSITFILQFKNEENPNDDCIELRNVLKNKYPSLNYEIIII
jgi:hypothetical protein